MIKNPAKFFPSATGVEGVVVDRWLNGSSIQMHLFHTHNPIAGFHPFRRLVLALRVLFCRLPAPVGMLIMSPKVARSFAYHVLYLMRDDRSERVDNHKYLVDLPDKTPDELPQSWGQVNGILSSVGVIPHDLSQG